MSAPRILFLILVAAVVVRVGLFAWVLVFGVGESITSYGDGKGYIELATNLAQGNGFVTLNQATQELEVQTLRAPGLPFLLAPFTLFENGLVIYGFILAILSGILLPFFTYHIGTRLFTNGPALIAAALVAFEPHMVWFSFVTLSEIPFLLAFMGGIYCVVLYRSTFSSAWIAAGLLLGSAVLIRPPFLPIFGILVIGTAAWSLMVRNSKLAQRIGILIAGIAIVLLPWSVRNFSHTGSFAISAMGWYNLYFDYVSSIYVIEDGVDFGVEKNRRAENPPPGVPRSEIQSTTYSGHFRNAALEEMWAHKGTVVKLESLLLFTFFTNDSYYYYLRRYGLIDERSLEKHTAASHSMLAQGMAGVRPVVDELMRQRFIPIFGRVFTIIIVLLALWGLITHRRNQMVWLLAAMIGVTALVSTTLGLGVEARLRLPVQPLMFMLAGAGLYRVVLWYDYVRSRSSPRNSGA